MTMTVKTNDSIMIIDLATTTIAQYEQLYNDHPELEVIKFIH